MFIGRKDAPSISCQDSCQHLPASLFFFFGHPGLCPPVEGKQRLSLLPWESIFPPCLWHQPLLCILRIRSPPLLVDILMPGFHREPRLSLLPNQPGSLLLMSFGWMVFTEQTQQGGISLLLPEKGVRKKIRVRDQQYSECFLL